MSDVTVAPERPPVATARDGRSRTLKRQAGLPSGRAVVGGFLVAASALGMFAVYEQASAGPTTSYVVSRLDIPVGTRLTADHLSLLAMDLPDAVADRAAFASDAPLLGATTVGPIRRGELVQAGDVIMKRSEASDLEISFSIDSARAVAGSLRAGERVDILATFGAGGEAYTLTVVRQARVLGTDHESDSLAGADVEVISLALSTSEEALALTHAINAGEVTLVRSTGSTASGPVGQTYRAPAAGGPTPATASGGG